MAKISILIALLPHLLCAMVQGQSFSCSEYFTYMTKHGITDMLGQIKIPSPSINDEFYLKVALTTTTEPPSQVVRLELAQSIQESILAVSFGRSLLYHVYYPTHEPIPSLSAIWFNNHRYCPANGNISATIELGHILYPLNEQPLVFSYGSWQQISQPWHRNSSIYRIDNPSYDRLNYNYGLNECGITSYYTDDTNRLIPNGEKTYPGQWPWFVAIYVQHTGNENVYIFHCPGSILTNRHVITATFCIMEWNKTLNRITLIESQRVYVSFGQFISREWHGNHTGIINRVIEKYTINNRLAILNLKTAVEYNAFIRPICLWTGSTNLQNIVNMTGYVVGWGYDVDFRNKSDNTVQYHEEPRMIQVPLIEVNEGTPEMDNIFVIRFAPPTKFYELPVDTGGGFVVFNITTGSYQLRGVGSKYFTHFGLHFIDVAHYSVWIRDQISIT